MLALFDLFDKMAEQHADQPNWQVNATFLVGRTQYQFNEFVRIIIKPFYLYLIEYIHLLIRERIKLFFDRYKQVIIYVEASQVSQS